MQSSAPLAELEQVVASNPDDLEARYRLGASYVMHDRMEDALETFLSILQRDRGFRDDIGRKSVLAVFELLGNEGELVASYRRRLFTLLH